VGDRDDIVQVRGVHHDRHAIGGGAHQSIPHKRRCTNVEPTRGVFNDQCRRRAVEFAAEDELLLVAT
jgi:hypothetical protein